MRVCTRSGLYNSHDRLGERKYGVHIAMALQPASLHLTHNGVICIIGWAQTDPARCTKWVYKANAIVLSQYSFDRSSSVRS